MKIYANKMKMSKVTTTIKANDDRITTTDN